MVLDITLKKMMGTSHVFLTLPGGPPRGGRSWGARYGQRVAMADEDRSSRFALGVLPHLGSAYRLARWLTRNHEDAEEVVQEACLSAFRALDTLRGPDARAWLLAIVRHTAYALLRQRQQRPAHEAWHDEMEDAAPRALPNEGLCEADPQRLLLRREDAQRLNAAVAALPTIFREVLCCASSKACPMQRWRR
jgi:RNA polymerase sigma factor (sigma-70 family)